MSARVERAGEQVLLRTEYANVELCRAVPGGRWNKARRAWVYPATPAVAAEIARVFSEQLEADEGFYELVENHRQIQEQSQVKDAEELPPIPETRTDPWHHQLQAFWFAYPLEAAALFMGMGTGKSKVAIDLLHNRDCQFTLIACPLSVVEVWPEQVSRHSPAPARLSAVDSGGVKPKYKRAREIVEWAEATGKRAIVVINYESLWRDPFAEWALSRTWDMVIADESHRISGPGTKASRYLHNLRKRTRYRLALTGTPLGQSPLNIYGQYRFLDPGIFGTNFSRFRQRYAVMGGYGGYEVLAYPMLPKLDDGRPNPYYDPSIEEEYESKLHSIAFRATEDVLDLPPAHDDERTFKMPAKTRKRYNDLWDDLVTDVAGERITATNALTRLLRFQQLTSGFLPDEDGRIYQLDTSKRDRLKDILIDLDLHEPVVVFCRFTYDLRQVEHVCEELGREYRELSGSRSDLKAWQKGDGDVLATQIRSGGVGIDLTRAAYGVYYSLGFSLLEYEQSRKRLDRPGQDRSVLFMHLICEQSVDRTVYKALSERQEVSEYLLNYIREGEVEPDVADSEKEAWRRFKEEGDDG